MVSSHWVEPRPGTKWVVKWVVCYCLSHYTGARTEAESYVALIKLAGAETRNQFVLHVTLFKLSHYT